MSKLFFTILLRFKNYYIHLKKKCAKSKLENVSMSIFHHIQNIKLLYVNSSNTRLRKITMFS